MVASRKWARQVAGWGGKALIVHEAPGDWQLHPLPRNRRARILYVGRFAADEPWQQVIEAARRLPDCEFSITGEPERSGLAPGQLPGNVTLTGYLDADGYRRAVHDADLVICLTTEPGSVMRSAYEAVWAGRPLIVSDWPVCRQTFPYAVPVVNAADGIAAGVSSALIDYERLAAAVGPARERQQRRWLEQLTELRLAIGLRP